MSVLYAHVPNVSIRFIKAKKMYIDACLLGFVFIHKIIGIREGLMTCAHVYKLEMVK